jgi:hypothetical protein
MGALIIVLLLAVGCLLGTTVWLWAEKNTADYLLKVFQLRVDQNDTTIKNLLESLNAERREVPRLRALRSGTSTSPPAEKSSKGKKRKEPPAPRPSFIHIGE